jgi:flavorubredoxin
MNKAYEVKKGFYWVGVIDWNLRDFHGYQTEKGSTYNSYLLMDEKPVLFDGVKAPFAEDTLERISSVIEPGKIKYIVVNHVEMDHSGGLPALIDRIKPEKVICSEKGKEGLLLHFHRADWPYHVVKSGDRINVGKHNITFIETPMLHWPDSMFSYIEELRILVSSDAFGQHWATSNRFDSEVDHSELMLQAGKYYANIILPYSALVQKLLKTVTGMGIKIDLIAPDHGLIWRDNISDIIAAYSDWSLPKLKKKAVIFYDTMWKSTEKMAFSTAEGLMSKGVDVRVMKLGEYHRSDVITEILDSSVIVACSATLNNEIMPQVADMLTYLKGLKPTGRIGAALSSYGWNPIVLKKLNAELTASGINVVDDGINLRYVPQLADLEKCFELGVKLSGKINL